MFDKQLFQRDPRSYALDLVEQGLVPTQFLLSAALAYMSHDEVRDMLDANELSPRFDEDADDDEGLTDDQAVFFAHKQPINIGKLIIAEGTVKAHRDNSTQLNRVKVR